MKRVEECCEISIGIVSSSKSHFEKEQEVANKTYNAVSIKWAEEFMNKQLKS